MAAAGTVLMICGVGEVSQDEYRKCLVEQREAERVPRALIMLLSYAEKAQCSYFEVFYSQGRGATAALFFSLSRRCATHIRVPPNRQHQLAVSIDAARYSFSVVNTATSDVVQ